MPPVRRHAKAVRMVDPDDVMSLEIGPPSRAEVVDGGLWRRLWAKRWPAEGADLMASLPEYSFEWALATFGDPRRRRSARNQPAKQ